MRVNEAVRKRIQGLCALNDITLNKLSTNCGITQSTLNNIIHKKSNNPTISTITKVCDGLNIKLKDFFDDDIFMDIEQEIK
jgi:transcriptional regulator with XRE-family HTH domain